ncbi:hypothetical protein SAMN05421858_2255 [Haladaptatus litoreus]|uniref:Uncharacterized protein n=1 Tax=Haladaptatus litoreus TaxID=553468 RepID=A0A1N7A072_9EURY|nr:hypothetical protein SAMN05421858_2255 [Haladaptatus litoreus]
MAIYSELFEPRNTVRYLYGQFTCSNGDKEMTSDNHAV